MPTSQSRPDNDVTDRSPAEPEPDDAAPRRRRLPTFGLSVTQLVATGLAATTATIAASFLGVTGTVIGAALASMTTAVGNAVYGQSLRSGRDRVRDAVPVLARPAAHPDGATASIRSQPKAPAATGPPELPAARLVRSVVWKRAAFGAVSVFVAVLAVVTGIEVVAGRPIADVVRGDSGSGTSFFGDAQVRTTTVTPSAPTPTVTITVTPKVVITTPTVTRTAVPTTRTAPPGTARTTPTSTATSSAGASASPSAHPSAHPSASPSPSPSSSAAG